MSLFILPSGDCLITGVERVLKLGLMLGQPLTEVSFNKNAFMKRKLKKLQMHNRNAKEILPVKVHDRKFL